jgi:hypothetical protein
MQAGTVPAQLHGGKLAKMESRKQTSLEAKRVKWKVEGLNAKAQSSKAAKKTFKATQWNEPARTEVALRLLFTMALNPRRR